MAFATLISRLTGFARIVMLAAILGAALSSAFSVANQLPNLVAALVLEATFTAIFVPVLARAERDDADGGAAFVRRLVTLATALAAGGHAAVGGRRAAAGAADAGPRPASQRAAHRGVRLPAAAAGDLLRPVLGVHGDPEHPQRVRAAGVGAGRQQRRRDRHLGRLPGDARANFRWTPCRWATPSCWCWASEPRWAWSRRPLVLLVAIRRERISLRPLWGIDDRLKRFGAMAAAMVFYVLISQIGLIVGNQIASTAAASGPAIYNYTWLVLMLPFGMIGVTVLTVVMPRLSRNAAADDTSAVLADLSLATRLTMVTLIPTVAFMTVGGPAIGSALFAYGNFGDVDAGYLGMAIALSAFTLIPYAIVLLELRVFYAREQPWIPIVIIVVITTVKIVASLLAPHITDNAELVAGYLGLANGLGFLAGAIVGYFLLRQRAATARRSPARPSRGAHHPGDGHRVVAGRAHRPRGGRADGDAPAHRLRRRCRFAAAAVRARGDHVADHGRGHGAGEGARG